MREKGEQSLHEAQKMREELESRSRTVEQQLLELKQKEKKVATVSRFPFCVATSLCHA